eukprot:365542-Chlamydomonas_euryale.AAC.19
MAEKAIEEQHALQHQNTPRATTTKRSSQPISVFVLHRRRGSTERRFLRDRTAQLQLGRAADSAPQQLCRRAAAAPAPTHVERCRRINVPVVSASLDSGPLPRAARSRRLLSRAVWAAARDAALQPGHAPGRARLHVAVNQEHLHQQYYGKGALRKFSVSQSGAGEFAC